MDLENVSLEQVIWEIQKKTDFVFMYGTRDIEGVKQLTVQETDKEVNEILKTCLKNTGLWFEISGNAVVIKKEVTATEGRKITGKVVDEKGNPLPGVTVIIKGTSLGTVTSVEGEFTITLPVADGQALLFSFVGMETMEVKITDKNDYKIVLKEDVKALDDVVVTGYFNKNKDSFTGAQVTVKGDELRKVTTGNVLQALSVFDPSIRFEDNIDIGSNPNRIADFTIRGNSGIGLTEFEKEAVSRDNLKNNPNLPTFIMDGFEVDAEKIFDLDIERIESLTILKDASATAIYGSSGANGVIIVTTKRGQTGKPKISYNGYVGVRSYTNLPDMMSGDEYVQLAREATRGGAPNYIYKRDEQIFTDPSELQAVKEGKYFDWLDAVSSPAFMTNHSLSAIGGTEAVKYGFSGGYYFEDGMIQPQEYTRYNLRSVIDITINKHVSFGGSMYAVHSIREKGNWDLLRDVFRMRPTQHPNSLVTGEEIWKYSGNNLFNPLVTSQNQRSQVKSLNLQSNIYLKITPIENLELTSSFSPYFTQTSMGDYIGVWTKAQQGTAKGAKANATKDNSLSWIWDNIVNYTWKKSVHSITATGVFSAQKYQYDRLYGASKDLSFNSLWYNLNGGAIESLSSNFSQWTMMSYVGRINYGLMDRYLLTASLRYDGSSRLSEGNKWALFPSAAIAWRITEEDFAKNLDWLSNLKLRFSYGQAGNTNSVSPYASEGTISGSVYYPFGTSTSVGNLPANIANPMLTWERTSEYNVGLDFGFLNQRIAGNIEYYNRTTNDLLMKRNIPVHLGYSSVTSNVGSVRNSGFELQLNTANIMTKNFAWNTTINLAYNKNEIVSLADEEDLSNYSIHLQGMRGRYSDKRFIGKPVDTNWTQNTIGVWQLGEEEEAAKYGCVLGNFKIKDYNNDGKLTDDDYIIDGKRTPDWTGGMTNMFKIYDFDFSFHMYFQAGATQYDRFFENFALEWNSQNFNNLRTNYWTPENPSNTMGRPSQMGSRGNIAYERTDFLKVSYITLGYTLNKRLMSKWGLDNARIYVTVQNPFILTKFRGLDPEQPDLTNIGDTDGMTMNALLGVNISF